MRILLAEDDPMIGEAVHLALRHDGHACDWVSDGQSAHAALRDHEFDLVVLDLSMPKLDGLTVLQRFRQSGATTPVLIATARDAVAQRIQGLDAGADDYLVKPYDLDELLARLRALHRRHQGRTDVTWAVGDLRLNQSNKTVQRGGQTVNLSAREFALLSALMERPGRVLSRHQLEEKLYGWSDELSSNAVAVHIHGVRKKLGADLIRNVRGMGYVMPHPDQPLEPSP